MKEFYTEFKCTVGSSTNSSFLVKSEVRQEFVMLALLFIIAVDWVMGSTLSEDNTARRWTICSNLEDLINADDLALLSHLKTQMQRKTSHLQSNAKIGQNFSINKTEVLPLNTKSSPKKPQLNGKGIKTSPILHTLEM